MLSEITALIITYNEAPNIVRTLEQLHWVNSILIIDSGSDDGTVELVRGFSNTRIVHRPFEGFAQQCNYGLSLIDTEWVLSLDADYVLSDRLAEEIRSLQPCPSVNGYRARFVFRIHGRPLRGSLYPPRTVLYRVASACYENEGHGHRVRVSGNIQDLSSPIFHDDRKPLARWFRSQQRYAVDEARHLVTAPENELSAADRLRRLGWPLVLATPFYVLLVKGCVFDGVPGWHYALQRLIAECMIALALAEARLRSRAGQSGAEVGDGTGA